MQELDEKTLFVSDQPGFAAVSVRGEIMQVDMYDVGHNDPVFTVTIARTSRPDSSTVPRKLQWGG